MRASSPAGCWKRTIARVEVLAIFILKGRPWLLEHPQLFRAQPSWNELLGDVIDWIVGYPIAVAKPEEIYSMYPGKRFDLQLGTCAGEIGDNELVFTGRS